MRKYLKMSDAFKGTVKPNVMDDEALDELMHGDCEKFHLEDDGCWLATGESHMKYAAHAINHHDSLVKENEKLKDHLKQCADELAGMIARYNKQDMETGEWKYDYQTPFDAHKLLNEINKELGEAK